MCATLYCSVKQQEQKKVLIIHCQLLDGLTTFLSGSNLSVALRYQAQLFSNAKEAFTIQLI